MEKNSVTFAAFADLHLDIMHDGARRLKAFLQAAEAADVDFIIHLGDFCYPRGTERCVCPRDSMPINILRSIECPPDVPKEELLARFSAFPKPSYPMLGNHEMDFCTKEDAMEAYHMASPYYAFRCKGWHFIALDGNHYRNENGEIADYCCGNYFGKDLPYLGESQLAWLEEELQTGDEPTVLLCHQAMHTGQRGLKDGDALKEILQKARNRGKYVYLCINGHVHRDLLEIEDGVVHYALNSISNFWAGEAYETRRFSPKVEEAYPNLRFVFPYQKPVFAIITLNEDGMRVRGVKGRFVQPGSRHFDIRPMPTASVRSRDLKWPEKP